MSPFRALLLTLACCALACGDGDEPQRPPDAAPPAAVDAAQPSEPPQDAETPEDAEPSPQADAEPQPAPQPPGLARNVIVFMGDGMGPEQLSTGRYARPAGLRMDALAGPALVNTDSLTTLIDLSADVATDSAAAASVIATGSRVYNDWLSLTSAGEALTTVLEVCQRKGKATGLVTTSFFYDASPAAFAVHQPSRSAYAAIVRQMLTETRPDVIMGNAGPLPSAELDYRQLAAAAGYRVLEGASQLMAWEPAREPRLLGLFATDFVADVVASEPFSMTPALVRRADSPDPTLATMTARALERLGSDPDGLFLFAEDEIFDEMGHRGPAEVAWANRAYPAQVAALDDAIGVALDWVEAHSSFDETLIVLLADHETGGYHYDHTQGPETGSFSAFSEGSDYRAGYHTRTPTAVYARGPGSDALGAVHEHADTHRLLLGQLVKPP